jgi:hypothetical protein
MKMTELEGIGRVTSCMGTVLNNKIKIKPGTGTKRETYRF